MLAFLGLFKTCFCTYAAQTERLTLPPSLTNNLYNCQMKLVGFLLGTRPAAHWLIMFSLCCGLWLLVSSDLLCLSLCRLLSVSVLVSGSLSVSISFCLYCCPCLVSLLCFSRSSRVIFYVFCATNVQWGRLENYSHLSAIYSIYTTFIGISMCPQHVPLRGVPRETFVQQIKLIAHSHSQ